MSTVISNFCVSNAEAIISETKKTLKTSCLTIVFKHTKNSLQKVWNRVSKKFRLKDQPFYFSSHHSFSLRTCSSSLAVKSFLILKVFRISSGVFPLIMFATVLHVTSKRPLMSRQFAACGQYIHNHNIAEVTLYIFLRSAEFVTILNHFWFFCLSGQFHEAC